jgi:hypothetical protein
METYKPYLTDEGKAKRAQFIAEQMFERGGRIVVTLTPGSGMAYRYKPELYYLNKDGKIESQNLTYWMAACRKERAVVGWFGDTLRGSGIGYDRAHEAAYNIGWLLWELAPEITRQHLERPLDFANTKYYEGN